MSLPRLAAWNVRGFNSPDKVWCCKELIRHYNLDLICVLENRIHKGCFQDPWFRLNHCVYDNEASCNNFDFSKSGRIWVKWNATKIHFSPSFTSSQMISGDVLFGRDSFFMSVIYASNSQNERTLLWEKLKEIRPSSNKPWVILGDFNCYRNLSDKSGGTPLSASQIWDLNSLIFDLGLLDLASKGLNFTWFNQRAQDPIHLKLDRMLINDIWLEHYPTSFYEVASPSCSDHSPIILQSSQQIKTMHRFLFKNFWTKQDSFWHVLLHVFAQPFRGNPIHGLYSKLKMFKLSIKGNEWAKASHLSITLDDLKQKQTICLNELDHDPHNLALNHEFKNINSRLMDCSSSWTNWILQRAKLKWLSDGEDNLKFLYAKIRIRKNHSCSSLVASDDTALRKDQLSTIIQHFKRLFNHAPPSRKDISLIPKGTVIPSHLSASLTAMVTDEEIKAVIFSGNSNSSPGPDGFNFEFYKATWIVTGPLVCKAVKSFFTNGYLPQKAKATAIALIPKSSHASNVADFRPIALCNVFYKIIAKVLALRLKDIMPFIIGKSQTGFIKERISSENILLASELLQEFKKSTKHNLFCAKLDIKKAFDSVSRYFLLARMLQKGFSPLFISWVKACITNVHFSICIDGALESYFNSSSGLRQGCPLSPYLFCIVMDALTCMIDQSDFLGVSTRNTPITHLLYADDLLIFGEATLDNCAIILDILNAFYSFSGLQVNHDKSNLIISNYNTSPLDVCAALNVQNHCCKMEYLGIPIVVKKLCLADFQPLFLSISQRLAGWKARLLSIAGRLQYLKYIVWNTIAYWIRGAIMPQSCLDKIGKMCAKFLYFGDHTAKKLHLVSWKNTCKPKNLGGLGIPSLNAIQFACCCSLIIRFYNSSSLLSDFLYGKYGTPWTPASGNVSPLWKWICKGAEKISDRLLFAYTLNCKIAMLWDPWINDSSLTSLHANICDLIPFHAKVSDFVVEGSWNFPANLNVELVNTMNCLPISSVAANCITWKDHKASFSVYIREFYKGEVQVIWFKEVWHKHCALKFSIYIWLALNRGLKTADILSTRHIFIEPSCSLCFFST